MQSNSPGASKKEYKTPQLKVYGDIGSLTTAVGTMTSVADGGMGLQNKTS